MQTKIREAALKLGYIDAQPVTGQPFDVWRNRLSAIPLGQHLSFSHDPAQASGRPLEEITLWVAIAPTPPMADWPMGCGEIGAFYMHSRLYDMRYAAWEEAVTSMGYEVIHGIALPVRAAAIRAGLGVHGLNGLLIAPQYGSFVDISVLLIHAAPPTDARGSEHDMSPGCGNCGECIKACPTGAISEDGVNSLICLRHYITHPELMPENDYPKMERRIQGCDTCQQACPHNAALVKQHPPADFCACMKLENLLTKPDMDCISKYMSPGYMRENRVKTQAVLAAANGKRKDLLPLIEALVGSEDDMLDQMARWSVKHLRAGM